VGFVVILTGLALVLRRGVPKAYGMGMVMMVVFLLDVIARWQGATTMQAALGFQSLGFFRGEAWWSPLTSAFVHAPPAAGRIFEIHLIANLFVLLTAGPALEERVGERRFLLIFFVAHAAALAAHVLLGLAGVVSPFSVAIGASGGIFGVLTAFAVRYPRERLPMLLLWFIVRLQASIVLLIYLGFNLAYFLADFTAGTRGGIAWWGHFAGFAVGLAWASRLPAVAHADIPLPGTTQGLPDAEKLAPLATTPELKRLLDRVRQFTPEARTSHDSAFALGWVDKFLEKATCPDGHAFSRQGLSATCEGGETRVDFAR
jgi:membrane associated rhomboid family serine protease